MKPTNPASASNVAAASDPAAPAMAAPTKPVERTTDRVAASALAAQNDTKVRDAHAARATAAFNNDVIDGLIAVLVSMNPNPAGIIQFLEENAPNTALTPDTALIDALIKRAPPELKSKLQTARKELFAIAPSPLMPKEPILSDPHRPQPKVDVSCLPERFPFGGGSSGFLPAASTQPQMNRTTLRPPTTADIAASTAPTSKKKTPMTLPAMQEVARSFQKKYTHLTVAILMRLHLVLLDRNPTKKEEFLKILAVFFPEQIVAPGGASADVDYPNVLNALPAVRFLIEVLHQESWLKILAELQNEFAAMMASMASISKKTAPQRLASIRVKDHVAGAIRVLHANPFEEALEETPVFNFYRFPEYRVITLTSIQVRPADLLLRALFGQNSIPSAGVQHGLFNFANPNNLPIEELHRRLSATLTADKAVRFSAKNVTGTVLESFNEYRVEKDLTEVFGDRESEISHKEIREILDSLTLFTSPLLPVQFFYGLKDALHKDMDPKHKTLPGNDHLPFTLRRVKSEKLAYPATHTFLSAIEASFESGGNAQVHGFTSKAQYEKLLDYTMYQIGAMVVRSSKYILLVDGNLKLRARLAGDNDMIRQIDLAGIRGQRMEDASINHEIMRNTFMTALTAVGNGIMVVPAVGMGVWAGDPDVYWNAFLEAVFIAGNNVHAIYVNSGHRKTPQSKRGAFVGSQGEEFDILLKEHMERLQKEGNKVGLANLRKIINLFVSKKDILHLAHHLKQQLPQMDICLVNASDPDVTLGGCTGMYVLNQPHIATTEENYAAAGTSLLTHLLTEVTYKDPTKVFQTVVAEGITSFKSRKQIEDAK